MSLFNKLLSTDAMIRKTGYPLVVDKSSTNGNLLDYSIYGNSEQKLLPDGYTQLEYIQSSGGTDANSSYINTNYKPNYNTKLSADVIITQSSKIAGDMGTANAQMTFTINVAANYNARFGTNNIPYNNRLLVDAGEHIMTMSKDGIYIDDTLDCSFPTQTTWASNTNLYLFKFNGAATNNQSFKMKWFKIWDNDVLVRNFIPAKRDSDNAIGMYDTVSNTFFTNAGTGVFTAGPACPTPSTPIPIKAVGDAVKELPDGYEKLEYLQSSGEQYIDTGLIVDNTDDITIRFKHLGTSSATSAYFGSMPGDGVILPRYGWGKSERDFVGVNDTYYFNDTLDTNWHTIRQYYSNSSYYAVRDDVQYTMSVTRTQAQNLTAYLFARHGTSGVQTYDGEGTAIAYLDWKDSSGNQRMKLIPAKRNSDNVLGMYDTVSQTFFTNQGTGTFTAGPVIQPSSYKIPVYHNRKVPFGYTEVEYIEAVGTKVASKNIYYIDTGVAGSLDTEIETNIKHIASDGNIFTVCASENNSNGGIVLSQYTAGPAWAPKFGNVGFSNKGNITLNTFLNVVMNKTELIVNGTSKGTIGATTLTDTSNLYILCDCWGSPPIQTTTKIQMKNFIIRKSGVVVFNGIPARRNSDNVIGMWDTVSETFLTNQGTGTYTAGADVNAEEALPIEYDRLEYLESSGTQWINTGIVPTSSTKTYIDYSMVSYITSGTCIGAHSGSDYTINNYYPVTQKGSEVTSFRSVLGVASTQYMWYSPLLTTRHQILFNDNLKLYIDGSLVNTWTEFTSVPTNPIYLFWASGLPQGEYLSPAKIYSCKIWQDGTTLSRNFIPALRKSDNVVGMYDRVTGQFLTNAGTGTFIAGPVVREETVTNIILNAPLRRVGNYQDELYWGDGKNLFDESQFLQATSWTYTDGAYTGNTGNLFQKFFNQGHFKEEFKPNTQYTFSYDLAMTTPSYNGKFRIFYTDSTYSDTGSYESSKCPHFYHYTFTSTAGKSIDYIKFAYTDGASGTTSFKNVQIEEGTTATAYQPYNKTPKITRLVGCKVLDGTESDWQRDTDDIYINKTALFGYAIPAGTKFLISHFGSTYGVNGFAIGKATFYMQNTGWDTVSTFTTFLATQYANGTPVVIFYPLATQTTETKTDLQGLPIFKGTNTYIVNTEVKPDYSKNLFDKSNSSVNISNGNYVESNGEYKASGSINRTIKIYLPAGTYNISRNMGSATQRLRGAYYGATEPIIGSIGTDLGLTLIASSGTFTIANDGWVVIWYASRNAGATSEDIVTAENSCMLVKGSTATAYEPYQAHTISEKSWNWRF